MAAFHSKSQPCPGPGQNEWFPWRPGVNGRRQRFPRGLRPTLRSAAARGPHLLRALVTLLLALALECMALPVAPAAALALPWRHAAADRQPAASSRGVAPLQEVSPPQPVQQLQTALGARQPVLEIVSPQPDSLLPAGPWTLRLRVHDWPLVDGGALGLGPHLVVQLDQEPPRIWTRAEGELPELSPGSHRLTVYAAMPWGEARKNPGAVRQIRLHRTAPNPAALPAPGSPQLLAVSPRGLASEEPLLLDWLLLDAPLQDVGGNGSQWRLRVSINGDDVLLDQQTPLWLRGWRPGPNALRLELLDGRGEPLNSPFNSLVQEVDLRATEMAPRWRAGPLSDRELAILIGEAPSAAEALPAAAGPGSDAATMQGAADAGGRSGARAGMPSPAAVAPAAPGPVTGPGGAPEALTGSVGRSASAVAAADDAGASPTEQPASRLLPQADVAPTPPAAPPRSGGDDSTSGSSVAQAPAQRPADAADAAAPQNAGATPAALTTDGSGPPPTSHHDLAPDSGDAEQSNSSGSARIPMESSADSAAPPPGRSVAGTAALPLNSPSPGEASATPAAPPAGTDAAEAPRTPPTPSMTAASAAPETAAALSTDEPAPESPAAAAAAAAPPSDDGGQERIRPSSTLTGRARDLVNDDGTLRRPEPRGPLAGLRERLQR